MSYNSGLTNVTGTVTSTETKRALICLAGTASNVQTTTLATVGAGKVWRIVTSALSMFVLAGGGASPGKLQFNDVDALIVGCAAAAAGSTGNNSVTQTWTYGSCPVLTAGQTIKIVSSATSTLVYGSISYIEESA